MTNKHLEHALWLYKETTSNRSDIARKIKNEYGLEGTVDSIRKKIARYIVKQESKGLLDECEQVGIPVDKVKHYWYKGKHYSINVKGEGGVSYEEIRDELIEEMKEHAPVYPTIVRSDVVDGHLLVIDPADVHIGKLTTAFETGEEYNSQIAVQRTLEGVDGILNNCKGFDIEKILFVGGNDILHIDTPKRTTTAGTPQDTSGMWYDNFMMAARLYQDVITKLSEVAPVHFVYNPSNHDYTNGFFLAQLIEAYFRNNKNITCDVSISHRKYYVYGKNLIGTTHGDGAKMGDLGAIMAHESSKNWGECTRRYWYTHHLHHKVSKDYIGVTVEALRSPSASDSWHHRNGYIGVPKAIEGFIHHKEYGQVCRLTHLF